MRVLMQVRSNMYSGGEATQVRETSAALRARGIEVEVTGEIAPDLGTFDLVHVFGLTQPSEPLLQAENARRHGLPVVLSPAYQDLTEYNRRGRYGLAALAYRTIPSEGMIEALKQVMRLVHAPGRRARLVRLLAVPFEEQQRGLLDRTSVVLPNSPSEARAIAERFGPGGRCRVVPYAASPEFFRASANEFQAGSPFRDFVIAVGFITSLKNQLRLMRALQGSGLHLVIAGRAVPSHRAYSRAVRRQAARRQDVTMLGHVPREHLASALAAARVVALPSWFETCGMACLEGALAGCRVVVTDRGYTRDYFGDSASYCDPGDVASIRGAVMDAVERRVPEALQQRILREFTWDAAADATLDAYRSVV